MRHRRFDTQTRGACEGRPRQTHSRRHWRRPEESAIFSGQTYDSRLGESTELVRRYGVHNKTSLQARGVVQSPQTSSIWWLWMPLGLASIIRLKPVFRRREAYPKIASTAMEPPKKSGICWPAL